MSDVSYRPLNLGNTSDDDPQVLDSLVQQEATPPTPVVEPIVTPVLLEPRVPTRLLSGRQLVNPSWENATLLLPQDTDRRFLTLSVDSVISAPIILQVADPAVGVSSVSVTVPDDEYWELLGARYSLATSAVAGNRIPEVGLFSPTGLGYLTVSASSAIAASGNRTHNWWVGGSGAVGSGNVGTGLPENLILAPGSTITASVFGMDIGDDIGAVRLVYRLVNANDGVIIRSDNGGSSGIAFLAAGESVPLDNHTGSVFVKATGTNPVTVNYWSVTR